MVTSGKLLSVENGVLTLCLSIKFDWTGEGLRYLTFLMLPQDGHILLCCQVEGLILVESQEDEVSDADRLRHEGLHFISTLQQG